MPIANCFFAYIKSKDAHTWSFLLLQCHLTRSLTVSIGVCVFYYLCRYMCFVWLCMCVYVCVYVCAFMCMWVFVGVYVSVGVCVLRCFQQGHVYNRTARFFHPHMCVCVVKAPAHPNAMMMECFRKLSLSLFCSSSMPLCSLLALKIQTHFWQTQRKKNCQKSEGNKTTQKIF